MNAFLIPLYSSSQRFVDREEEIQTITDYITALSDCLSKDIPSTAGRTVVLRGERGSGKTWLCLHLKRAVLPTLSNISSFFVRTFATPEQYKPEAGEWFAGSSPGTPESVVLSVLHAAAAELCGIALPQADLDELSRLVASKISEQYRGKALVILFDSAFENGVEMTELLEKHFLEPLTALPSTFFIISGRGQAPAWRSAVLRTDVKEISLKAFSAEQTREQLRAQAPEAAERYLEIQEVGGGHPLSNLALANQSPEQALDTLLSIVDEKDCQHVQQYLEALSPLSDFREAEMSALLGAYFSDPRWNIEKTNKVKDELLRYGLMNWGDNGGYVLSEPIQILIQHTLAETPTWEKLNRTAYELYSAWAKRYPVHKEFFDHQAKKHFQPAMPA